MGAVNFNKINMCDMVMKRNLLIEWTLMLLLVGCWVVMGLLFYSESNKEAKEIQSCVESGIDVKTCEYLRKHKSVKFKSVKL